MNNSEDLDDTYSKSSLVDQIFSGKIDFNDFNSKYIQKIWGEEFDTQSGDDSEDFEVSSDSGFSSLMSEANSENSDDLNKTIESEDSNDLNDLKDPEESEDSNENFEDYIDDEEDKAKPKIVDLILVKKIVPILNYIQVISKFIEKKAYCLSYLFTNFKKVEDKELDLIILGIDSLSTSYKEFYSNARQPFEKFNFTGFNLNEECSKDLKVYGEILFKIMSLDCLNIIFEGTESSYQNVPNIDINSNYEGYFNIYHKAFREAAEFIKNSVKYAEDILEDYNEEDEEEEEFVIITNNFISNTDKSFNNIKSYLDALEILTGHIQNYIIRNYLEFFGTIENRRNVMINEYLKYYINHIEVDEERGDKIGEFTERRCPCKKIFSDLKIN